MRCAGAFLRGGLVSAVQLGGDTDTVAALVSGLLGAKLTVEQVRGELPLPQVFLEQIMNPTYAATQFYRHLLAVPDWRQLSVNDAAQTVQRSAFPDAYAQHEQAAHEIVAATAVAGARCTTTTAPS